ncbi:MAG: hypothetical protein R3A52_32935 [Polyangiales bacterium]
MGADHLGPEGALALASIAREAPPSTRSTWAATPSEVGAKAIADAVTDTPRVRALWIKRNALGPEGAAHPRGDAPRGRRARVEVLDVVSNELGPEGRGRGLRRRGRGQRSPRSSSAAATARTSRARGRSRRSCDVTRVCRSVFFAGNEVGDEGRRRDRRRAPCSTGSATSRPVVERHPGLAAPLPSPTRCALPGPRDADFGLLRATSVLGVSRNVGDGGAVALARVLRENRSLRSLDLRGAGVGHEGASALYEAALDHPTLSALLVEGLTRAARVAGADLRAQPQPRHP